MNLKIDAEFMALIPPLRAEELQQLELNLLANGYRDPLVTWQGILRDGHNRTRFMKRTTFRSRPLRRSPVAGIGVALDRRESDGTPEFFGRSTGGHCG